MAEKASSFSASQFLKAYENEFLDVIDAKVSLPKLRRRGVISADVQATIENADDEDAREALYDHLVHSGTVESLKKYCNVAIAADGYPRMQQLGREMLAMLPQGVRAIFADLQQARVITGFESKKLRDPSGVVRVQSKKSPEVMAITADILRAHGFANESQLLLVIVDLQQANLITSKEYTEATAGEGLSRARDVATGGKGLSRARDVVKIQSSKSPEVMTKTAEVLRRRGFDKESEFLSVCVVLYHLRQADLITEGDFERLMFSLREESKRLSNFTDVIQVQSGKHLEVVAKTADVLRKHGFDHVSQYLEVQAVFADLQQADLITSEECKGLSALSDVVRVQSGKSPEVVGKTANVLRRHGFVKECRVLSERAFLAELHQAELTTGEEKEWLRDPSDVVRVQRVKSHEVMARTAQVLMTHGFEKQSRFLSAILELYVKALITSEERERLSGPSDVVRLQRSKSIDVLAETALVLRRHEFEEKYFAFLEVLARLREAGLITGEECRGLSDISDVVRVQSDKSDYVIGTTAVILMELGFKEESTFLAVLAELGQAGLGSSDGYKILWDHSCIVRVLSRHPPEVATRTAVTLEKYGFEFENEFNTLRVFAELEEAGLMASEECKGLNGPSDVVAAQRYKSPEVVDKTAEVLRRHGFEKESNILAALLLKRKTVAEPADQEAQPDTKATVTDQHLDAGQELLEFEKRYSKVLRTQASVTLKITKCTTIGPPRKGKTCLKHLLTGQKWDVEAGTASTDVMEAPEWVECLTTEGGAEELWKLVSEEEQQKKVIKAVIGIPVPTTSSLLRVPSTTIISATTPSTTFSGAASTTTLSGVQLHTTPSGVPPPPTDGGVPLPLTAGGAPPPHTVSRVPPPLLVGAPHPPRHSDSVRPPTPTDTSPSGPRVQTLMQGIQALASACSPEALKKFLKDKEGKVIGETQLIHFIDTGGQSVYHDVHPVLITSPSVYLVVFSLEDFYQKDYEGQLSYFRDELIQRPLESICAFGTKTPQDKDHLEFHPEAPKIFIVGTHLDQIPRDSQEQLVESVDEMIEKEISSKPYRQFVQFDTKGRSFWAVDNTQAGRELDKGVKQYISTLRLMVQDKSMEMSVKVPLPWMLLKVVMEGKGVRYCKYSELLEEARIRGYVREDSANADLDTMLRVFHILSLFYHKAPKGCKKEDSLVFIDPGCLFSATSDFLMAAKEELEDSKGGSNQEDQHQIQSATVEEEVAGNGSRQQNLQLENVVEKQRIIKRMKHNVECITDEVETVLPIVNSTMARIGQEPTEVVLESLHAQLKVKRQEYQLPPEESQIAASVNAKRQLFLGKLVNSLASSIKAVLDDSGRKGDVRHDKEKVDKAVEKVRAHCQSRSIHSKDMDQFLAILSDLRIVAQLSDPDSYVVPAALPKVPHSMQLPVVRSAGLRGSAAPIFVTVVSQTVMLVCYLPSCLFCCLINELVTGLGWTVIPLERTHVAFTHKDLVGPVHMMEHQSYIEIKVESHLHLRELAHTCQAVRRSIHGSIVDVYKKLYSGPTADSLLKEVLVWGFQCEEHPEDYTHIAAFQENGSQHWTECLLEPWNVQDVAPDRLVWFSYL